MAIKLTKVNKNGTNGTHRKWVKSRELYYGAATQGAIQQTTITITINYYLPITINWNLFDGWIRLQSTTAAWAVLQEKILLEC